MKISFGKLAASVGVLALCFSASAFAQYDTITYTGPNSATALGFGAGIYGGTLQVGSGPTVAANFVCDDYADHIQAVESWQATGMTFSSITSASFGGSPPPHFQLIGVDGYAAVAALTSDILASSNSTAQGDMSAALWYITAGGVAATQSNPATGPTWASLDANSQLYVTQLQALYGVGGDSTAAQAALALDTNLWLYTPTGNDIVNGDGFPQEFISGSGNTVPLPEGGAGLLYLLLAAAACFGAIRFRSRNQLAA